MKVKTIRQHKYGGKWRASGDVYEILNRNHVLILEAGKKIERIPEKISIPVPEKKTPVVEKKIEAAPKPKRKYKRRDMTAQSPFQVQNRMNEATHGENADNDEG